MKAITFARFKCGEYCRCEVAHKYTCIIQIALFFKVVNDSFKVTLGNLNDRVEPGCILKLGLKLSEMLIRVYFVSLSFKRLEKIVKKHNGNLTFFQVDRIASNARYKAEHSSI